MINRYIIVGESVLLSQSSQSPFKSENFIVELRLPLKVFNTLTELLKKAEYLLRIEANREAAKKVYLQVAELSAPYARSENDRRTLKQRAESLLEA